MKTYALPEKWKSIKIAVEDETVWRLARAKAIATGVNIHDIVSQSLRTFIEDRATSEPISRAFDTSSR